MAPPKRKSLTPRKEKSSPDPKLPSEIEGVFGKTVTVNRDGVRYYGRVKGVTDGEKRVVKNEKGEVAAVAEMRQGYKYIIELAVPDTKGVLHFTDAEIIEGEVKEIDAVTGGRAEWFESHQAIVPAVGQTKEECVKFLTINGEEGDSKHVIDYRDVFIEGYASTFKGFTASDRDGDAIDESAFGDGALSDFLKNPVMLTNHSNNTKAMLGSFDKVRVDRKGLFVQGRVTNSPEMRHERFLIAEGHLKAFSVGGFFFFDDEDERLIKRIEPFETSVVPIPANQDALFERRDVTVEDVTKAMKLKSA